jgi:cytochrome P450
VWSNLLVVSPRTAASYAQGRPPSTEAVEGLRVRVISDYELSRRVVASKAFRPFTIAENYSELSARFGHDFGPAISLFARFPAFMDGEAHKRMRMAMARLNERNKPQQLEAAAEFLRRFEAEALRPGNELDLMGDLAVPLFRAIGEAATSLAEAPAEVRALAEQVPVLFATFTPLKQRLRISERLNAAMAEFGEGILDDLALLGAGIAPLVGSLALSLHAVFRQNPAVSFSAIAWPQAFPESAVQYVDRICKVPVSLGGESFAPGEFIRCLIQSPEWSPEENRSLTFGAGQHLCLGRSLSELVWVMTVRTFAAHDWRAEPGALVMEDKAEPFERPARAPIVIREADG